MGRSSWLGHPRLIRDAGSPTVIAIQDPVSIP
jgi:hypothetical protein